MADYSSYQIGPGGNMSIADMYSGIYPPASSNPGAQAQPAEGLKVRTVKTVPISIDGLTVTPIMEAARSSPKPTQQQMQAMRAFGDTPNIGTGPEGNRMTAGLPNLDIGPRYPFGYTPEAQNSALNAINGSAPRSIGSTSPLGELYSGIEPNMGAADPWGDKLRGPTGGSTVQQPGFAYGTARAAAPAPKPAAATNLLTSIASLFTGSTATGPGSGAPGWSNPNITYSPSNMTSTAVDGSNQSFNPTSMQQSSRWNSGY